MNHLERKPPCGSPAPAPNHPTKLVDPMMDLTVSRLAVHRVIDRSVTSLTGSERGNDSVEMQDDFVPSYLKPVAKQGLEQFAAQTKNDIAGPSRLYYTGMGQPWFSPLLI